MKKVAHRTDLMIFYLLLMIFAFQGQMATVDAAQKKADDSDVVTPSLRDPSAGRNVRSPSNCGGLEFDRRSGSMIRRPNVDLIVTHLEITTTDRGTWVKPTIRNLCTGSVSDNIHVAIGEVVVTIAGLPPETDYTLEPAVNVPAAATYTAVVDYDDRISESNELNNRCTRSATGDCP